MGKKKVFIATATGILDYANVPGFMRRRYGEKVKINLAKVEPDKMTTYINQNKNSGTVFL